MTLIEINHVVTLNPSNLFPIYIGCFKNSFTMFIPDVTVWRVLRKCLHLKAYKLSFKLLNDG
jgi:hypothetical protein